MSGVTVCSPSHGICEHESDKIINADNTHRNIESESCSLCLVLEPMNLLRQAVGWDRDDLHNHIAGAMIQVDDDGDLNRMVITEAVRSDQILYVF